MEYWIIEKNKKKGIFDSAHRQIIIPVEYTSIDGFRNGYAQIMIEQGDSIAVQTWDKKLKLFQSDYMEL